MHVLWEKLAVEDPEAHAAKRRKRWLIAGAIAAASALTVLSFGVWGLVYPAIVVVVAAMLIEPMYWLRKKIPPQRIWTDGTFLGVDGAAEVIGHPRDPVPLSSVAAVTVYPIEGGFSGGPTIGDTSTSSRVYYSAVDLWLGDGSRRLWIFDRQIGLTIEDEAALAQALHGYLPDRWRVPPDDDNLPADVGSIERDRLARWLPGA